jgi:ribosome biogenesis GTPase A
MTIVDKSVERLSMESALHTLLMMEDGSVGCGGLREKLLSLEKKLASNQLHLAVVGQMKRGKSSFINALLGTEILPTGVLPVTSVITEIRYGVVPEAAILYSTGQREMVVLSALADYITESANPGNKKRVASVEISHPSPFLEAGIILIDTPGIGSTHAHNTRTTESYLQQVDAAIVVLSVDPPITEIESQFVKSLKEDIPKLFFLLNKTDLASADEVSELACFLRDELTRIQMESPEIFLLSARSALERKRDGGVEDSSGTKTLERRLRNFLLEERFQVLVRSVAMDALQVARTLKFALMMGTRAWALSPQELDNKRMALDHLLVRTEVEVRELGVLLRQHAADIVARVEGDLTARVEASVPTVRQHLNSFYSLHAKETGRALGTLLEDFLMHEVEGVFRCWRVQEDEKIEAQLGALSGRFVAQTNAILERLEKAAGLLFEIPVEHVSIQCPLRVESHLSYKVERIFYSLDSFLLVLPRFLMRPLLLRRLDGGIGRLLDMNAGRIRYDYLERLQASLAEFEHELCAAAGMVTESLRSVLYKRHHGVQRETPAVATLDAVIQDCSLLSRWV